MSVFFTIMFIIQVPSATRGRGLGRRSVKIKKNKLKKERKNNNVRKKEKKIKQ